MRRLVMAVLTGALVSGALVAVSAPSSAAVRTVDGIAGEIETATQARDGSLTVSGWAFRPGAHSARRIYLCVWSDNACRKVVRTEIYRHRINDHFHLDGRHGFKTTLPASVVGTMTTIRPVGVHGRPPIVAQRDVLTPGQRVVNWSRLYVGKSPYRSGGASPSGFDCSGYTMWVYDHAGVQSLPHQTNAQRSAPYMRRISSSQARPGDLIFYLSGSSTYHVAVYAGHGMQYAATVPGEKIKYQGVWSSHVEYRTDWH